MTPKIPLIRPKMSTLTQKLYCLDSNLTNLPNFTKLFQNLLVSSQNIHQPIQNLTIFEKTYLCSTCPNFNCNCQNQFNCKKIYLFYKYLWFLWESNSFFLERKQETEMLNFSRLKSHARKITEKKTKKNFQC